MTHEPLPSDRQIETNKDAIAYMLYDPADKKTVEGELRPRLGQYIQGELAWQQGHKPCFPKASTVVCWLDDFQLSGLIPLAIKHQWRLGILPHPARKLAFLNYGISQIVDEAIHDLLMAHDKDILAIDVLFCNGQPVLNSVIIGDTLTLASVAPKQEGFFGRWLRFLRTVRSLPLLRLFPIRLTTQKEKTLETAAMGLVVIEHGRSSVLTRRLIKDAYLNDGALHALVIAPRSLMEMLRFLVASFFLPGKNEDRIPSFVGHFKSATLNLSSRRPLVYSHDQVRMGAKQLDFEVAPKSLAVITGRYLKHDHSTSEVKESFRVQSLPVGEAVGALSYKPLPLINHAAADEYKDLFLHLRENARLSESFLVLMVLSTLLASFGLFANSSPVIIGAMILAPLMSPIISLSMGVLRQNSRLIADSGKSLSIGVALALTCATVLTWLTPLRTVNPEIAARLSPTLLDLGVAVISGIAGAYAHARAEVAKSLAGVAIAVALVPPLAVAGIGIGWGDWSVFYGALLLFLTNLSGIVLAAALTFLILGFSPFQLARRGLITSSLFVIIVSIPLAFGFKSMVEEHRLVSDLVGYEVDGVIVRDIVVRRHQPLQLAVRLLSRAPLDERQMTQVKQAMEEKLGQPVILEITVAIVR